MNRYLVFWGAFLINIVLCSILAAFLGGSTSGILSATAIQNVVAFALPAIITGMVTPHLIKYNLPASKWFLLGILLLVGATPMLEGIIDWNANVSLPASMQALEQTLRTMEDAAQAVTDSILAGTSVWILVRNILLIGVLTGICEELFFRGGVQGLFMRSGMNVHIAVWVSAFIFSLMHFQFFGFVPRLLLGALFGYIYYCSGSIWVSALLHALNNSAVVFVTWLTNRGAEIPDSQPGWWLFALSVVVTAAILIFALKQKRELPAKPTPETAL